MNFGHFFAERFESDGWYRNIVSGDNVTMDDVPLLLRCGCKRFSLERFDKIAGPDKITSLDPCVIERYVSNGETSFDVVGTIFETQFRHNGCTARSLRHLVSCAAVNFPIIMRPLLFRLDG